MAAVSQSNANQSDTRITARPGTPEYQRQFEQQVLASADLTLRMGIVRVACGLLGLLFAFAAIVTVADGASREQMCRHLAIWTPLAIELLSVAIRGKSMCLRLLLSGVQSGRMLWGKGGPTK